jgi:hypothetical protein
MHEWTPISSLPPTWPTSQKLAMCVRLYYRAVVPWAPTMTFLSQVFVFACRFTAWVPLSFLFLKR